MLLGLDVARGGSLIFLPMFMDRKSSFRNNDFKTILPINVFPLFFFTASYRWYIQQGHFHVKVCRRKGQLEEIEPM